MQITIRNRFLLRLLGFHPSGNGPMVVGLSVRDWLWVVGRRLGLIK